MRFSRGFSFIEVMMVVALIGIMVAVTFVSLSGKRNEETLKAAAREVAASIRTAQSNALAGLRKGVDPDEKNLCWVIFKKEASNDQYSILTTYLDSGSNCTTGVVGNGTSETFSLSNGVVFGDSIPWNAIDVNFIRFEIPRANVLSGPSTICLERNSQSISVSVSAAGVVTESVVSPGSC